MRHAIVGILAVGATVFLTATSLANGPCNQTLSFVSDIDPDRAPEATAQRSNLYALATSDVLATCEAERAAQPRSARLALLTARAWIGLDSSENLPQARDLLREAIMLGSIDALTDLAHDAPDAEAVPLLSRASEAGHAEAMLMLAERLFPVDLYLKLENGGFPPLGSKQLAASAQDIQRAKRLLAGAAEKGETEASMRLATMADAGIGGAEDNARAERLYRAADSGYGLYLIAEMYRLGELGPVDPAIMREKYQASADRGQIDPLDELGAMLEQGIGGPADPAAARRLYEGSLSYCHGGIADRLAMMLMRGDGGPADTARAAKMHLRAITCHNSGNVPIPIIRRTPGSINRETWRAIQALLAADGYYDGPQDGILGPRTAAAVNALWKAENSR